MDQLSGCRPTGNFCSACGAKLPTATAFALPEVLPAIRWEAETRYDVLLHIPEVRDRLAKSSVGATKKMTGEEWLGLYDQAFKPLTGVSLKTVATIAAPIYAKMGIKTGKTRFELLCEPPGRVIVDVLCALAQAGLPLVAVHQAECGCIIEAKLPSDLWSFEGQIVVTVEQCSGGTKVEAATNIPGQWFDWGKSTRCLEKLFTTLRSKAA